MKILYTIQFFSSPKNLNEYTPYAIKIHINDLNYVGTWYQIII